MAGKHFGASWEKYFEQTLAGCDLFLCLPIEVNQIIAEFLPWSRLLCAIDNVHTPRCAFGENRLECNTSYLIRYLQKNPWWINGSLPDRDLWSTLWENPFDDETIVVEYIIHRHEHMERRHTESWNQFYGTMRFVNQSRTIEYKKPTFWTIRTLDSLLGELLGRDEETSSWGYLD